MIRICEMYSLSRIDVFPLRHFISHRYFRCVTNGESMCALQGSMTCYASTDTNILAFEPPYFSYCVVM